MLTHDKSTVARAPVATQGVRRWSLRTVFVTSLLVFCLLPALVVGWVLYRSNLQTVDTLSEKIVNDVALRVMQDTQDYLFQAHIIFNGLLPEQPTETELNRARQMMLKPELFEQAAFSMVRMSSNVSYMYLGTVQGEFLGIETNPQAFTAGTRVGVRSTAQEGRKYYSAQYAGDRTQALAPDAKKYEPRSRPWFQAAVDKKERVFTKIYPSASKKQLLITLAQPVYSANNEALGVFAIDLYLKRLSDLLQGMVISPNGAAFLMDEEGYLVASSAGDSLFVEQIDNLQRVRPDQSSSEMLRTAYAQVQSSSGRVTKPLGNAGATLQKIKREGDNLLVSTRSMGKTLGLNWTLVVVAPESDFAGQAQSALKKTALLMILVVGTGALLAAWFAYRLTRRFEVLAQAAVQLGQGEIPAVQHQAHITEVYGLSTVLHDSAEEIARNQQAIESQAKALIDANDSLEDRVLFRTQELEASREDALAAARAKASFLATMSHEIRTPLNGVMGMTSLLADTPLNVEQRDYLHTMRVSSDQLLGVINDILDFSKIESGKLDLESELLSLQATLEEACDMAAPRAREKGLELVVDMGDDVPAWVHGDITRLRQILLNYINNAVKFTDHGQVLVTAAVVSHAAPGNAVCIEFKVKDSGIGIPADRQAALFQSFTQVDASTTRKYGGTGLGLAICKRLALMMDGQVGLESEEGKGSTFWFTAQLKPAPAPEPTHASALELSGLRDKLVVVVDDSAVNLRILDKQLQRWGIRTVLFSRAQPALDWLASHPADAIITDMHMPEMDGLTFTQKLRATQDKAYVVLLTSGSMPTGAEAKLFDARFFKPYRQSQLFDALAHITNDKKTDQATAPAANATAKQQRILVADDNAVNLKVALAMLSKLGYETATAVHGLEAVDLVARSLSSQAGALPFAAILMDANMPVMDGFDAARQILSVHGSAAPAIIALTASVLEEDRRRCIGAGMVGFLAKPLRLNELAGALARYARSPGHQAQTASLPTQLLPKAGVQAAAMQDTLMDWSRLQQFKEFDDDALTMTHEVIALFVHDIPQRAQDILQALHQSNSADLSLAAHALKGAASNVGASALTQACFVLEQSCLDGRWPSDAAQQVALVAELSYKTMQALKDW